jgi:hypothetical protein
VAAVEEGVSIGWRSLIPKPHHLALPLVGADSHRRDDRRHPCWQSLAVEFHPCVFSSLLWTGVDLFMGFVLGPILRRVDLSVRREIVRRLTPRTLFLMPTVSIISGTTGWFLAVDLGYTALAWPGYGWVAAALVLVTLMTIQGLGFLTPVNVLVCLELQRIEPDLNKIGVWTQRYFYAVALQGLMQVAIIIVMTRFRIGV